KSSSGSTVRCAMRKPCSPQWRSSDANASSSLLPLEALLTSQISCLSSMPPHYYGWRLPSHPPRQDQPAGHAVERAVAEIGPAPHGMAVGDQQQRAHQHREFQRQTDPAADAADGLGQFAEQRMAALQHRLVQRKVAE